MKQEEVKVGMYVTQNGRIHCKISRVDGDKWTAWLPPGGLSISSNDAWRPSLPAELSAAGVKDEDRLIEQQSWREGVRLWDWPTSVCPFISIDDDIIAGVTGKIDTINCPSNGKKPESLNNGDNESPTDLTSDPRYAEVWQREHLRDFVLAHRSRRAGGEGLKKLACGLEVRAGDLIKHKFGESIYRVSDRPMAHSTCECSLAGWDEDKQEWGEFYATHHANDFRFVRADEIASTTIKLSDIRDEKLRAAVEALRRPTLPDGSEVKVNEMYVSNRGWLQRVLVQSPSGTTWQRDYFDPNCKRWLSGMPVDGCGQCSSTLNCLARLAVASDIPNEVSIDIVPSRIREQVRQQRGAGALKWEENNQCVVRFVDGKMWRWKVNPNRDAWEESFLEKRYFDRYPVATASQIIAANVPEQDIPACQIEGVRAERGKQASVPLKAEMSDRARKVIANAQSEARKLSHNYIGTEHILLSLIREPNTVAGNALANCGVSGNDIERAVFNLLGIDKPASSPSPESGACQCEAANTLRDLIEAYNERFNMNDSGFGFVEWATQLHRKFELARESLGEASNTEAA